MKIPNAHQSTALPWDLPEATSGDTYSWVPTNELDRAVTGSATKSRFDARVWTFRERNKRRDRQEKGVRFGVVACVRVSEGVAGDSVSGEESGDSTAGIASEQSERSKSESMM